MSSLSSLDLVNISLDAILLGVILAGIRMHLSKFKEFEQKILDYSSKKETDERIDEKLAPLTAKTNEIIDILKTITKITINDK